MTSGSFFVKKNIKYFNFKNIAWKVSRNDIFEEYCWRQWFGHLHRNQMLSRHEYEQISVKRPLMVKFARWNLDIDFKFFVENNKNRPFTGLIAAHIFQLRENSRSRCGEKRTFAYLRLKLKIYRYDLEKHEGRGVMVHESFTEPRHNGVTVTKTEESLRSSCFFRSLW